MSWFERLFGIKRSEDSPFGDARDDLTREEWSPVIEDSISLFSQIGSLFSQYETLIHDFDGRRNGHPNPNPGHPRDALLKERDSDEQPQIPTEDRPYHDGGWNLPDGFRQRPASPFEGFDDQIDTFQSPFENPLNILEEMMKSFSGMHLQPYSDFQGIDQHPRIEERLYTDDQKVDKDMDSGNENAALLLKEGPGYSVDPSHVPVQPSQTPSFHHNFKSTTIIRTRKPDGTVEERSKYTDSSGRDEETITTYEPQDSRDSSQDLAPPGFSQDDGSAFSFVPWFFSRRL